MVAILAPTTPKFMLKMKIGSNIILQTAPKSVVPIAIIGFPSALIKGFKP